jgi:arginine N-succinyltransferase
MLLKKQGFKISHYVDLFDAGPHMYAPTEKIHAVESSHEAIVQTLEPVEGPVAILSNTRLDFRATLAPIKIEDNHATLPPETAEVLKIVPGDVIRYYFP